MRRKYINHPLTRRSAVRFPASALGQHPRRQHGSWRYMAAYAIEATRSSPVCRFELRSFSSWETGAFPSRGWRLSVQRLTYGGGAARLSYGGWSGTRRALIRSVRVRLTNPFDINTGYLLVRQQEQQQLLLHLEELRLDYSVLLFVVCCCCCCCCC